MRGAVIRAFFVICVFFSFASFSLADESLRVVTTLFPQYDFVRQIAGDKAELSMLLPIGTESHSYDPSPADIVKINSANLFIYTGENMEAWAHRILDGIDNKNLIIVDSSNGILPYCEQESDDGHKHDENSDLFDPHIWTDPNNAMIMTENISKALCSADPRNARLYRDNAAKYIKELEVLDKAFSEAVKNGVRNEVIFGGRNPFIYFLNRYGLNYKSAYASCANDTDPGVRAVARLVDDVKTKTIPVIFYEEIRDPKVARAIADETGAKILLFHSCHNVSREEFKNGATYISLMLQNLKNLKEALR